MRIPINSCDFSLDSYNFDDVTNDYDLKYFDMKVTHDQKYIIPFIQQSKRHAHNNILLVASPWSPPAWMKVSHVINNNNENKDMNSVMHSNSGIQSMLSSASPNGLRDEHAIKTAWAKYISKLITAYRNHGIQIWAITPQNEPEYAAPWEACIYNASFEYDFIQHYLGPILRVDHPYIESTADGLPLSKRIDIHKNGVKILYYDHNKENLLYWATMMKNKHAEAIAMGKAMGEVVGNTPEYENYIDGIAFHWYSNQESHNIRMLDGTFGYNTVQEVSQILQSKTSEGGGGGGGDGNGNTVNTVNDQSLLLNTEACSCLGVRIDDWGRAERLAHDMMYDLHSNANGYIVWNLLVDEIGGPNHVKNYCDAPIIVYPLNNNLESSIDSSVKKHTVYDIHYQPSYYYLKHFSKFITPYSRRIFSQIIGNYNYNNNIDPQMIAGIELGLYPCEKSSRQLWVLNSHHQLEMLIPSLMDPYNEEIPVENGEYCNYDHREYSTSYCNKRRLCLVNGNSIRPYMKLMECDSEEANIDKWLYNNITKQIYNSATKNCIESIIDSQQNGYLLRVTPCDIITVISNNNSKIMKYSKIKDTQQFIMSETGEWIQQHLGTEKVNMCVTAGWPFRNSISTINTARLQNEVTTVITNEADIDVSIRIFNNNHRISSSISASNINGKMEQRKMLKGKKKQFINYNSNQYQRLYDIHIPSRSITTLTYFIK